MKTSSPLFRALLFYGTRVHHRGKWRAHEKLRQWLHAEIDEEMEVTRQSLKFILNPSDHLQKDIFWYGEYDRWTVHHLKRMLKKGDTFLDVGANIGYISITLAEALRRRCAIHAFEPNPPTFAKMRRNIALNHLEGVIEAHALALSDGEATGYMIESQGNTGTASIGFNHEGAAVQTIRLDRFCETRALTRLDVIKVDIEGFEERFLAGARGVLERFRPQLCLEINPNALARKNSSAERVAGLLRSYGYDLYVARRDRLTPWQRLPASGDYQNVFCFDQNNRPAWLPAAGE